MGKGRIDVWKTIQIRLSQLHHIQLLITFKFVIFCCFFNFFQKKIILTTPFAWDFLGMIFFSSHGICFHGIFWEKWLRCPPFFTLGSSISKAIPVVQALQHPRFSDWLGDTKKTHGENPWGNLGDFCTPKNIWEYIETCFCSPKKKREKKTRKKVGFIRTCNWSTTLPRVENE